MSIISREQFFALFGDPGPQSGGCYLTDVERRILVALARHVRPQIAITFGTQDGQTDRCIWNGCPSIQRYIGIDLPPGGVPGLAIQVTEIPTVPGAAVADRPGFELVLHDSRDLTPADLPQADFLWIDGGHDYPTVKHDTELAFALARPGAVVVWHDYNAIPEIGVRRVIDELNTASDRAVLVGSTWIVFRFWSAADAAKAADASGGRGSSLPRTPTNLGAPADRREYTPIAAAPVAERSTAVGAREASANAGGGEAEALTAQPAPSSASAADRILVGVRGSELPRPPEASHS